jgi:hypothetical protein
MMAPLHGFPPPPLELEAELELELVLASELLAIAAPPVPAVDAFDELLVATDAPPAPVLSPSACAAKL